MTEFTEPPSLATSYTYDTEGNLTELNNADGLTAFTYTAEGWLESATDPLEHTVTLGYDSRGRLTSRTDALEHTATFAYDTASNLTSYTDERDFTTTFTYDALGRALTQVLPDDNPSNEPTITLTYDAAGNLTSVTDPVDNVTAYTYDELNRRLTAVDPLEHTTNYAYDATGNLTGLTDRNGRVRAFSYDAAGRLTNEDWLDEEEESIRTFTYTYDAAGQLTSASDPDSTYSYTYDALGQLTEEDNEGTPDLPQVVLTYTYDVAGNSTGLSDNLGASIEYEFDDLHRLTGAALTDAEDNGPEVTFTYDGAGRLTDVSRATHEGLGTTTGVSTSLTYDDADRLTDITHTNPLTIPPETIASYRYGYDDAGLATGYTGPEGTLSYTYNARGELTAMSGDRTESYSYDFNGNRTMTGYTTGTGNQLTSDAAYDYTYDDEGNLLTKTRISDERLTEFTWDYRNRLTKVLVKNSSGTVLQETRFSYDVYNRRIGKWLDADGAGPQAGVQQWTAYDGVNTYADFDGNGALTNRYLAGAPYSSLLARLGANGTTVWYLNDVLGSVRQLVDANATVLDQVTYGSYGNILSETSPPNGDRFKFTDREFDAELSAYYFRARYYDPATGRFVSNDPIQFAGQDPNLYRYVGNSPHTFTDPTGLFWWQFGWTVGGALVGGLTGYLSGGWQGAISGAAGGAAAGFLFSFGFTGAWSILGTGFVAGGISGAISGGASWALNYQQHTWQSGLWLVGGSFGLGAVTGGLPSGIGRGGSFIKPIAGQHTREGVATTLTAGLDGVIGNVWSGIVEGGRSLLGLHQKPPGALRPDPDESLK